ncbi:MAG: Ig-like domain-containing protein, partial [Acidobacteriota bacterium]
VSLATSVQAVFSQNLDPASVTLSSIVITNSSTGAVVSGAAVGSGSTVTWTATPGTQPLAPNATYTATVAPSLRGSRGAPFGGTQSYSFSTVTVLTNSQIHAEKIRITIPVNGVATITGDAGALPTVPPETKAWRALALRRGVAFRTQYQVTSQNDGSFSFQIGNCSGATPCPDALKLSDQIDLEILNAADNVAAILPLGPFTSPDGQAFVAPVSGGTTFTSRDGVTVQVPDGAFDQPTIVRVARIDTDAALAGVPNIQNELTFYRGVQIDFDCSAATPSSDPTAAPVACRANKRLDVSIPMPAGLDPAGKTFLLAQLGQSIRGPRLMIADTLRVDGSTFTTTSASGSSLRAAINSRSTSSVVTGPAVKSLLIGITHSAVFNVIDLRVPTGSSVGFAVMEGIQGNYDLFWDQFASLFASQLYLAESHGRIAIPILTGKPFNLVGVDAGTGIQAFSKLYNPLPVGDPGATFIVDTPSTTGSGPYPVFAQPIRVETLDVMADDVPIETIRDFVVTLKGGFITVENSPASSLPDDVDVTLLNVTSGAARDGLDPKRSDGLRVRGKLGDRILLIIGQMNVDPDTALSLVFNVPLFAGTSSDRNDVNVYLHTVMRLEKAFKGVAGAAPSYASIDDMAFYSTDSGGRRVKIELPSSLERGAFYRVTLLSAFAAAAGSAPGLRIGQVQDGLSATAALTDGIRMTFQVREVPDPLATFDFRQTDALASGSVRDLA